MKHTNTQIALFVDLNRMKTLRQNITELEQQLVTLSGDEALTTKLQLARWNNFVDSNRTLFYCNDIIESTTTEPDNPIRIQAQLSAGIAMLSNRRVTEAIAAVKEAEGRAIALGNKNLIALASIYNLMLCPFNNAAKGKELIAVLDNDAEIHNNLPLKCQYHQSAADFLRESDLQQAGVHLFKALECSKQLQQPWAEGLVLCKLGMNSESRQDLEAAQKFYADALPLLEENGCTQYVFQVHICMSKLMIGKKEYERAIEYAELAYEEAATISFNSGMDFATLHKITALLWMKRIEEAEPIAANLLNSNAANTIKSSLYTMMGNICIQKGDTLGAIENSVLSYELRKDIIRPVDEMTHNEKMYKLYVRADNYKEALKHFELFHNRKLLLANENSMVTMAEMQAKYDTEKKDAELQKTKLENIESELKALKAQMNPHFIFNSLNSIQEVFFTGDKRLANEHLSRFSQLMRNILRASSRQSLTLQEEIKMMEEYMALEALRLGDTFSYTVEFEPDVDIYTFEIPPMILQPFIENSIKHGLHHKQGDKYIKVHFTYNSNDQLLKCTITDNGIGRNASAIINKQRIGHQSFATSATARRFEILNNTNEQKFTYNYVDTADMDGNATGTVVHINIPIE